MLAPAKQVVLTNTKNKVQLNAMLAEGLLDSDYYTNASPNNTLTIAGISDVPVEIASGVRILTVVIFVLHMRRLISLSHNMPSHSIYVIIVKFTCQFFVVASS